MKTENISFRNVDITEGFWFDRQNLNSDVTIHSVRDRFADTGRFEAFKFNWIEGMENKPHFFWDSDVAKWLEACAYIIEKKGSDVLQKQVDEVVDLIEKNQCDDGYFNIYFSVVEPGKRFSDRDCHELYCAGHLIEAAVAYYYATGKSKFLKCMCKYVDLIEKVFKIEKSAAFITPGHEEIELALVKLYHLTKEKRYLELSKFFIDERGKKEEDRTDYWANTMYNQSHIPCRKQTAAQGHSVRACYLYSGMADIAREYNDEELEKACIDIYNDIYRHKLYITGGIGQSCHGEAFTIPYDLQNSNAYTETCAAISLAMFSLRIQEAELNSKYGDIIERGIYNGIISGISIDGKSFFYENPLEIVLSKRNRNVSVKKNEERFPISQRVEVFSCSCCPPNIARFISSIGDYIYGKGNDFVTVHQYISSTAEFDGVKISQKSGFPYKGEVMVNVSNAKRIALRIPEYSKDNFTIKLNRKNAEYELNNGYAFVNLTGEDEIQITFDFSLKLMYAHPKVWEDQGKCAVTVGPVVYCAEGIDNEFDICSYKLFEECEYSFADNEKLGTTDVIINAKRLSDGNFDGLYSSKLSFEDAKLRLIPYFAFANRGESDMAVWLSAFSKAF